MPILCFLSHTNHFLEKRRLLEDYLKFHFLIKFLHIRSEKLYEPFLSLKTLLVDFWGEKKCASSLVGLLVLSI